MGKIKTQRVCVLHLLNVRASPETTSDESGQVFLKECPHCPGRLFKSQSDAARHLASHNPEKPSYREICIECGKGFAQKSGLKSHKNIHSGLKPYACQMGCKMRSGDPSSRNRHEREVHDPSYSHKCCKCGASLKRPGQFIKHFKTCFGRPPTKAEILAACEAHKDEYMEQIKSGQVPPLPEKTRDIQRRAAGSTHADKDASASLASSPDALTHRESRTDDDQNPAADLVNHHSNGDNARVDDVSDILNDEPKAPSAPVRTLKPAHDLSPLLTNFESSLPSAFQGSKFCRALSNRDPSAHVLVSIPTGANQAGSRLSACVPSSLAFRATGPGGLVDSIYAGLLI
ncbi:hypothetical protein FRC08_001908 [Ceratobasidium sp. 394]|nr:hypothetical protein FRC08_001908 [Ceratobasidium sp. 394]